MNRKPRTAIPFSLLLLSCFTVSIGPSFAENFLQRLRQNHGVTKKGSIDSIESSDRHPTDPNSNLSVQTILNGLRQLSLNPKSNPKETFEELKIQEAHVRKELQEIANAWVIQTTKPDAEKSQAVEKVLAKEKDSLRDKLLTIKKKIKDQIDSVMSEMGYESHPEGSTSYKKGKNIMSVKFNDGEIQIKPIIEDPAG